MKLNSSGILYPNGGSLVERDAPRKKVIHGDDKTVPRLDELDLVDDILILN